MTRGSVRHQRLIEAPADAVWALVGAAERLHEWFPGITSSEVDGSSRTIVLASGVTMPETLLTNDPVQRRFQYRITAPLFHDHLGTIDVIELDAGRCLVTYATDADPRTMALTIGGATAAAIDQLAQLTEGERAADRGPR